MSHVHTYILIYMYVHVILGSRVNLSLFFYLIRTENIMRARKAAAPMVYIVLHLLMCVIVQQLEWSTSGTELHTNTSTPLPTPHLVTNSSFATRCGVWSCEATGTPFQLLQYSVIMPRTSTCTCTYIQSTSSCTYKIACTRTYVPTFLYVRMYVCMYTGIYMYLHVYTCMCIKIN